MKTQLTALAAVLVLVAAPAQAAILTGADDPVCRSAVAHSEARGGASLLVLKDGKPICEAYRDGPEAAYEIWSGTKSFVGVMAAAAVQDGLLTLDERVADTLPEWRGDPVKASVTIRQVLSLTSGLRSQIGRAPDYAAVVGETLMAAPGERFQYGALNFQLFGEIMRRKLTAKGLDGGDPLAYLKRRILDPIGLNPQGWRSSQAGDPLLPQGAILSAREWAKFGEFVRAAGIWNGRRLVDEAAFRAQFVGSTANPAYGLTWWLPHPGQGPTPLTAAADIADPALPNDLVMAGGAGDQRLYVIPSKGLTIVRQRPYGVGDRLRVGWSDATFLKLLLQ